MTKSYRQREMNEAEVKALKPFKPVLSVKNSEIMFEFRSVAKVNANRVIKGAYLFPSSALEAVKASFLAIGYEETQEPSDPQYEIYKYDQAKNMGVRVEDFKFRNQAGQWVQIHEDREDENSFLVVFYNPIA